MVSSHSSSKNSVESLHQDEVEENVSFYERRIFGEDEICYSIGVWFICVGNEVSSSVSIGILLSIWAPHKKQRNSWVTVIYSVKEFCGP